MKIRTRAIAMTAFILAFSMMSVPGLIGSQMVFGGAPVPPSSLYPVVVSLSTGETVFIAAHTSGLANGNWIELSGGTSIKLPSLTLAYAGLDNAEYIRDGVTVTIESSFAAGEATYPLETHQVYSSVQSITATFWGADPSMGPVDFRLIRISSITEARDILTEAFQGNLVPLKSKLSGATWSQLSVDLDGVGDATVTINPQGTGLYLLAVIRQNADDIYINSATIIEVVSQTLDVTCPSSVERGDYLYVNTGLTSGFIHGAIMIKETAYFGEIKLVTDGTVLSTQIHLNEMLIADEAFATESLSVEALILLLEEVQIAIGSNQMAIGVNPFTGSISLSTYSLTTGDYVLLVGVYDILGSKLVGIYQKMVTVTSPYIPPPANKLPVADAGPDQKAWVNRTVNFDGSNSYDPDGSISSWRWSFGDGETASGETVSHTYQEPGSYTVTLTVRDNRYGEDSDSCTVTISEPPANVTDALDELVPGGETDHVVDATDEANTTVTLNTTDPVTVTIIKYEDNPHPDDPLPANALPNYVDVEVSDPDAVVWPIYVEMSYTDEEIEGLDEESLGIYYWKNDAWHRCSNTGVDTENNIVWVYMTKEEASGSPILIAGTIQLEPAEFVISYLMIEPKQIELGSKVTISVNVTNVGETLGSYNVTLNIEEGLIISVKEVTLQGGESEIVEFEVKPEAEGTYDVDIEGMIGSFYVITPIVPTLPPILSDLTITPAEIELGEEVTIGFNIENIDSQSFTYIVTMKIGEITQLIDVELLAYKTKTVSHTRIPDTVGEYEVTVDGLTGSFTVKAPPLKPAEFEASNLVVTPREVEPEASVTVSATITNIGEESGGCIIELKLDGVVAGMKTVDLNAGVSETVTFTTSSEEEGSHSVEIDGLSGSFTVEAPPPKDNLLFWFAVIVVIVAIALYIIWKRTDWIDQLRASLKR